MTGNDSAGGGDDGEKVTGNDGERVAAMTVREASVIEPDRIVLEFSSHLL